MNTSTLVRSFYQELETISPSNLQNQTSCSIYFLRLVCKSAPGKAPCFFFETCDFFLQVFAGKWNTMFLIEGGIQLSSTIAKTEKQQEPAKMTVSAVAHLTPRVWLGCDILGRVFGLDWMHLRYLFDIVGDIYNHKWGHSARNTQTYLGRFLTFGTSTTTHCLWKNCRCTLPETNCSHLKIGRAPKGNNRIPTHPFSSANC